MIKTLRKKFIFIASVALLLVIFILIAMISAANYARTILEVNAICDYIVQNGGELSKSSDIPEDKGVFGIGDLREETPYEIRYFCVFLDENENITGYNFDHIATVSQQTADRFTDSVIDNTRGRGYVSNGDNVYAYRYVSRSDSDGGSFYIFLDCTNYFTSSEYVMYIGIFIGIISFIIFSIIVSSLSNMAIRPIADNMEKQKQFITNAGHELKTPLAIISANTEVIEMINGKNEWTESTINQVKRLSGLVSRLISLARMEESEDIVLHSVDFSAQVTDVAESFKTVASQDGKTLTADIVPELTVKGDENILHELVSILADNAVKYCDAGGNINISLRRRSKDRGVRLVVSNDYADGNGVDYSRFFDRFYREDTSHNSKKSGYGIGLSMAAEIVKTCKGKINVGWADGVISFTVTF